MKHLNLFILFAFSLILTTGCSDDDGVVTNTDLLTAHDWVVSGNTLENSAATPAFIDVFADLPDCQKDEIWTFEDVLGVGGYQYSNPVKCVDNEPSSFFGTWEFNDDETEIEIEVANQKIEYDILTLDNNTFQVKSLTNLNGVFYDSVLTYSKN